MSDTQTSLADKARQPGVRRPVTLLRGYLSHARRALERIGQYKRWVKGREGRAAEFMSDYKVLAKQGGLPTISLLVPVYNPPVALLKECLESVIAQVYPHWQLCIADDASTDPQVRECLLEFSNRDPRIKVVFREKNGHIVKASNTALELVQSEFVGLLDHDDLLAPHALLRVAEQLVAKPELLLVYSDEDKIDARGKRSNPH